MKKAWLCGAMLAAAVVSAGAANAAVLVVGSGLARGCYQAAVRESRTEASIETCDTALSQQAMSRDDRSATYVNRGIIHLNRNENREALRDFDRAVALTPNLAEAHTNRAAALLAAGDFQAAVASIDRALGMQPTEPHKAYFIRAAAYEELGNTNAAYRDYRHASELAPDWRPARAELTRFSVR
jgi:tetratricopeptide (TPR) repeat protein